MTQKITSELFKKQFTNSIKIEPTDHFDASDFLKQKSKFSLFSQKGKLFDFVDYGAKFKLRRKVKKSPGLIVDGVMLTQEIQGNDLFDYLKKNNLFVKFDLAQVYQIVNATISSLKNFGSSLIFFVEGVNDSVLELNIVKEDGKINFFIFPSRTKLSFQEGNIIFLKHM